MPVCRADGATAEPAFTKFWPPLAVCSPLSPMSDVPDQPRPLLTPYQRLIVGFAITMAALLGSAAMGIYSLIVFGQMVGFFSSVLWPLAVAGVLALILRPLIDVGERRLKLTRMWSVVVLYVVFVLAVAGVLLIALPPLIDQMLTFIDELPEIRTRIVLYIQENYPRWAAVVREKMNIPMFRNFVDSLAAEGKVLLAHTLPSLKSAGGGLIGIFAFVANVAIIPVYLFFFLLVRGEPTGSLPQHLTFLKPGVRDDLVFLIREFIGIVESFFRGQLIIGLIMGALLGIGFTAVGLKFGFVIGLGLGILNIIPYLGSIIGIVVTVPLAFFQPDGGVKLVMLSLMVQTVVQIIESYLLTPRIMGSRTGLHPVMIIVAVFFWGKAFEGILGMLLAIPLTAFFVTAWRLAKWKYFTVREETKITAV
jgi:predicted PurR-regulated permease PerM